MKPQKIKYAPLFAAMLLCVALAGCDGALHESGEGRFSQSETQDGTRAAPRADAVRAAAGGDIALPATLAAPQTDSTINTLLDAGVLSGAFTTVNSCRTRDLCTAGEITVRVRAELDAQTSRKDAKFALWKLADGRAEYLETVYFTCDGTVQSYTFTGLAAGARYRVVFSYTESGARRMSGAFNVEGVTAEIEEETQEEGAVAAGAQPGSCPRKRGRMSLIEDFKHMKWLPLAGGALLCVLGLTALVWPGRVAKILPLCIGAAILGLGLCEVASGFLAKSFLPEYIPGMRKLQGFVNVAVGLVFLLNRTLSLMFIAVVLGVWAVAFGALRLRDALRRRASGQPWGCCAGDAAVKFAVGIFMLASPLGSMAAWTVMVGLFFLFVGASVIFSAVYLDRLPHDFEDF